LEISQPSLFYPSGKSTEHWWNDTDRGKTVIFGEKLASLPFSPSHVSYGLTGDRTGDCALAPIHTMRHVSVPSPFHLRSVRMVSVHTVRRVQSPSKTAYDRRPAIISIKYAAPFVF
jgi:hypothetical protein